MKNIKKLLKFIGLGISIALIIALFVNRGFFMGVQHGIQNKFYDTGAASAEIVIVVVDEKSLKADELGPLQKWKRANYANAIQILNEKGAAVIGVDMTFPDKSTHGEADDKLFADAIAKYKNVVLAGRYYFQNGKQITEYPNTTLMAANPKVGLINVSLDEDGFVRKIPIFSKVKDKTVEAFSLQMTRAYTRDNPVNYQISNFEFRFSNRIKIPVVTLASKKGEESHFMYINYFAKPGSFTQISMTDLLKKKFVDKKGNAVSLKDKIVLIGPTAIDLQDYYLSPVSAGVRMPGVEIHANNIQTIISEKFLRDQSGLSMWLTLIILLAGNIFIFSKLRVRFAVPILFLEIIGVLVAGVVAYESRIFLNVIYPILTIVFSFVGTFVLRFLLEQSERKFIEGAFGHYVNKTVVEQIIKDPSMLELGGAKREVTAFFSDIAGFTSISEKMKPGELVDFLNRYLSAMTEVILDNQGTLDKYEGDAIMAFWGAPLPLETHARDACLAALGNQEKLIAFRKECEEQGLPPIYIRIGINSGEVIAGNMGSENRFDYTIMGDNVNLASRLESINKQYDTKIMISEFTYEQVKDDFTCRELDQIRVKGKNKPVRVYELVGTKKDVSADQMKVIEAYSKALELYRKSNFTEAKKAFEAITDDPPSKIFADRCAEFLKNPPEGGWDGVYTFDVK